MIPTKECVVGSMEWNVSTKTNTLVKDTKDILLEEEVRRKERVAKHVKKKLEKASVTSRAEQRSGLCSELLADLVGEVQETESNGIDGNASRMEKHAMCFYEVLAPYYECLSRKEVDELLVCFHKLWSSPHIPSIFTLLLHRWLFHAPMDASERLKYANVIADGSKPLIRWDMRRREARFKPVFDHLVYEVALNPQKTYAPDVRRVLLRFAIQSFLLYESRENLPHFLESLPEVFEGTTAMEAFMLEMSKELEQLSIEYVLLRYLRGLEILATLPAWKEVSKVNKARLQSAIHSLTSPGGPRYPPRLVRHAAIQALDVLYPQGRHARRMVIYMSRLMHPLQWPSSVVHHLFHWLGLSWLWNAMRGVFNRMRRRHSGASRADRLPALK